MNLAVLTESIQTRQRLNQEMIADLVAFRRGQLSEQEVLQRGAIRQFERFWLNIQVTTALLSPARKRPAA
jgi:hypothetical protein